MANSGAGAAIHVQVVYALARQSWKDDLALPPGTTAAQAVAASAIPGSVPGYRPETVSFGIFGQNCKPDHVLADGDRVEVYRPLIFDPMESRRRRAAHRKQR
jgi:putative ubiquitin-RnfH superfamily antitoxin RatB of RatAB toxin-antitoxin module